MAVYYKSKHISTLWLNNYPREMKAYVHKKTCTTIFKGTLVIRAKSCKQPRYLSTGEWINIPQCIFIQQNTTQQQRGKNYWYTPKCG